MKAILSLIQEKKLTRVQSALASFILDHAVEVCFMSSTKLAERLGHSGGGFLSSTADIAGWSRDER